MQIRIHKKDRIRIQKKDRIRIQKKDRIRIQKKAWIQIRIQKKDRIRIQPPSCPSWMIQGFLAIDNLLLNNLACQIPRKILKKKHYWISSSETDRNEVKFDVKYLTLAD